MRSLNKNKVFFFAFFIGMQFTSSFNVSFADELQEKASLTTPQEGETTELFGDAPKATDQVLNQRLTEYIRSNRESWQQEDLNLFFPAPHPKKHRGWNYRPFYGDSAGVNLDIYERKDPDGDPNHLYYYWNDTVVDLPIEVVHKVMTQWIDLSPNWTKELKFTGEIKNASGDPVWFQLFDPHILGVKKRRLMAAYSSTVMTTGEHGPIQILVSCRSIPVEVFTENTKNKDPRIQWHGAIFLTRDKNDPNKTRVRKIDRENQGGLVPAWIVNSKMPKYLREEASGATAYMNKNRENLLERYFRESGIAVKAESN